MIIIIIYRKKIFYNKLKVFLISINRLRNKKIIIKQLKVHKIKLIH